MVFSKYKLDKNSPVPLYYQLQNLLIEDIKNNRLKENDMLPNEIQLSNMLGVSRPTVRQALNNLVSKGYLLRIKGRGSFVTKPKITQGYVQFIDSYNQEMKKKGFIPKTKVLEKKIIKADEIIAEKLQIKTNAKVSKMTRLRYATHMKKDEIIYDINKPILLTKVYSPYNLFPNLINYDYEVFSLYEVLEKNNLTVKKAVREIEAKNIDCDLAKVLELDEGAAVHVINSIGFLENGVPIEYSKNIYPGERNKFIVNIVR